MTIQVDPLIRHFLYEPTPFSDDAASGASLKASLDPRAELEAIATLPIEAWQALIDRYILQTPCAAVVGVPSAAKAKAISDDDEARQKAQAAALGAEKLANLGEALDGAIALNERPIADDVLTAVPIPDYGKVEAIPLLTLRGTPSTLATVEEGGVPRAVIDAVSRAIAPPSKGIVSDDGVERSLWVEWSHVNSAFLTVGVAVDTAGLPPTLRLYLPLLLELAFKLPAYLEDGSSLGKDAFVAALEDETVEYAANTGLLRGALAQLASLHVKVEGGLVRRTPCSSMRCGSTVSLLAPHALQHALQSLYWRRTPCSMRCGAVSLLACRSTCSALPQTNPLLTCSRYPRHDRPTGCRRRCAGCAARSTSRWSSRATSGWPPRTSPTRSPRSTARGPTWSAMCDAPPPHTPLRPTPRTTPPPTAPPHAPPHVALPGTSCFEPPAHRQPTLLSRCLGPGRLGDAARSAPQVRHTAHSQPRLHPPSTLHQQAPSTSKHPPPASTALTP